MYSMSGCCGATTYLWEDGVPEDGTYADKDEEDKVDEEDDERSDLEREAIIVVGQVV